MKFQIIQTNFIQLDKTNQVRCHLNSDVLEEMAQSIADKELIQPIIVRPAPDGETFLIVSGQQRWTAARKLELPEIPCIVREDLSDDEAFEIGLAENLQRANLLPLEEGLAYKRLAEKHNPNLTIREIAERIHKSKSHVDRMLKWTQLSEDAQQVILSQLGTEELSYISQGHVELLLKVEDVQKQVELLAKVAAGKMIVKDLEKEIEKLFPTHPETGVETENASLDDSAHPIGESDDNEENEKNLIKQKTEDIEVYGSKNERGEKTVKEPVNIYEKNVEADREGEIFTESGESAEKVEVAEEPLLQEDNLEGILPTGDEKNNLDEQNTSSIEQFVVESTTAVKEIVKRWRGIPEHEREETPASVIKELYRVTMELARELKPYVGKSELSWEGRSSDSIIDYALENGEKVSESVLAKASPEQQEKYTAQM